MMLSYSSSLLSGTTATTTNLISFCLLIPNESRKFQQHLSRFSNSSSILSDFTLRSKTNFCFSSPQQFVRTNFSFPSLLEKRCDLFCVYALKKLRKPDTALREMSDLDEEYEMDDAFDEFDYLDDEDEDIEDEGMFLPFGKMKKWLENKPRGFGEGKVYDTSIEDKLLEEIEQSSKAQAANLDNLKNNPIKTATKKDDQKKKVAASGIRVCVFNLPKKKNIQRDLKSAFKEVPGIINIIPAVSGNKKTKDPVCKGFAFVDFKSKEDADRFVQQFSGQNITFGRIQKQIRCMMTNSQDSSDDESTSSYSVSNLTIPSPVEDITESFVVNDSSLEEDTDELITAKLQDVTDHVESFSKSDLDSESLEPVMKPTVGSFSLKKRDKGMTAKKKNTAKVKEEKVPKLDIPGSAKRLKIKEKSVLTDVFTKYGSQSALVSGEES